MSDPTPSVPCPRCATLEEQVHRLTMERQLLVERLAAERARANAMFVPQPPPPPAPPAPPAELRHRLVDSLNSMIYRVPGYGLARRLGQAVVKVAAG
jgi:hypothetical protein